MGTEPDSSRWRGLSKAAWAVVALVVLGPLAGYFWARELDERDERAKERNPVELTVQADPKVFEKGLRDWTGYAYVVDDSSASVPPPPPGKCRDRREWAMRLGAADADFTRLRVTIRGRPTAPVRIDDVRVVVHERRPPIRGTFLACPVGGATAEVRGLQINLDRDPPSVKWVDPRGGTPVTPPYIVSPTEEETFDIEAVTRGCDCRWTAELDAFVAGRTTVVKVGDPDNPFRTSPSSKSRTVEWRNGRWRPWRPE
jgi:hypothetical protein